MANYGPPLLDFSPLGDLASTFFNSRDKAIKQRQDKEAEDLLTKMVMGDTGTAQAPQAPAAPSMSLASLAQPKAPTFAAMQGTEPSTKFADMFSDKEREYALPAGYLSRTAAIESRFNPNAQNPNSSAAGLFQFVDGTAKQYGLSNKFDPAASTDAAARLAADNRAYLSKVLGREPTAGELYLAHQQGAGGAAKILANPNARAVDVVGADAVRLNGGDENMTAGQFATRWTSKVDGKADAPAPGAQAAQGFVVPGQAASSGGMSQQQRAMIAQLVRNPSTRQAGLALWQQAQKGEDVKFQDLGNVVGVFDGRGNMLRQIPKGQNPMAVGPEQDVIDPSTGRVIREGQRKPNVQTQVINGRVVLVDQDARTASDITPQGMPSGYRPMTDEEKASYGIPANTGAMIGPDGKPAALPGTATTKVELPKAETKYDEGQGKDYSDYMTSLQKAGRSAAGTKNTLRLMSRLTEDENFYSGFNGERALTAKKFLASLGVVDPKAAAPAEVFNSLANDVVLGKLGGSLGAGVSQSDVGFLQATAPGLANTKEGNRLLIAITEKMMDRQHTVAKLARDYAKQNGGRIDAGFEDVLAQWAQSNPLFTEQDFQSAQAAMKGSPAGGSALPVRVSTPEEARKLPSGTKIILPDGSPGVVP